MAAPAISQGWLQSSAPDCKRLGRQIIPGAMVKSVSVIVHQDDDEKVIQNLARILRSNDRFARQLRDFSDMAARHKPPRGLNFQPAPGQILACHFGLGFEVPENVKVRPVMVISPKRRVWSRLCVVVPISSQPPDHPMAHHLQLPRGLIPGRKYDEAWIKGDMVVAVGAHRLDRFKVGPREYAAPTVPPQVLRDTRRCILHAAGMDSLTVHW